MNNKKIGKIGKWNVKTNKKVKKYDIIINPGHIEEFKWEVSDF